MFFKKKNDNNIDNNDKNAIDIKNVENNNNNNKKEKRKFKDSINILHESYFGSVYTCIVRGTTDEITSTANKFNPLICDILPLTLEEIFIYELGGMGYEFENIII